MITINCERCTKPFRVTPSDVNRRKYCSLACRNTTATKQCAFCQKPFFGEPSRIEKRIYCSNVCKIKAVSHKVQISCNTCNKTFEVSPAFSQRKYCSKQCDPTKQRKRVTYKCENCGKEREVRPSETAKRFCGDKCRLEWFSQNFKAKNSPHWKGGSESYYGPNWRQQRNKARHRDGHRCHACNKHRNELPEELSVAHIIPFKSFGLDRYKEANALANLISMCRTCHIKHDWEHGHRT